MSEDELFANEVVVINPAGDVTVGVMSSADLAGDVTVGVASSADLAEDVAVGMASSACGSSNQRDCAHRCHLLWWLGKVYMDRVRLLEIG